MKRICYIYLNTLVIATPFSYGFAEEQANQALIAKDTAKQEAISKLVKGQEFLGEAALQKSWRKSVTIGKDRESPYAYSRGRVSDLTMKLASEAIMTPITVPVAGIVGAKRGWKASSEYNKLSTSNKVGRFGAALRGSTAFMTDVGFTQVKNFRDLKKKVYSSLLAQKDKILNKLKGNKNASN